MRARRTGLNIADTSAAHPLELAHIMGRSTTNSREESITQDKILPYLPDGPLDTTEEADSYDHTNGFGYNNGAHSYDQFNGFGYNNGAHSYDHTNGFGYNNGAHMWDPTEDIDFGDEASSYDHTNGFGYNNGAHWAPAPA